MQKIIILYLTLCLPAALFAQDENYASDRPGLTDAPDLIGKKTWQIASGADISRYNHYGVYQLSTNTLKYGLSKRFEARLDLGLQYDPEAHHYSVSGPSVGMKTLITGQHKIIPKTAFILEYYPPGFASGTTASGLGMEFCFSHTLKNGNSFYYNLGSNWLDLSQKATLNALAGYSLNLNSLWNVFAEIYVYKAPSIRLNYVSDLGVTFQVTKLLQFDFAAGLDIVHPAGNSYFDGGITLNF
ncbi:transporter [Pedobacter duraquae]|uniref:Outer membrane putative beta-barrel porin/alpha-amylase n=1 Tax=Pedobacter duraquae TaxID=425511 RepID=A0A4R6IEX5_9SPHI|nr:transporter [Pedobacter duraquae]TDO20261.1 outer membrane putative beta-barrel porin/alpha-amylase [Pedobacter duraquae]